MKDVRSLFISDLHLGCVYSKEQSVLNLLESCSPEYVYLVGDIFDGWKLSRTWFWRASYDRIIQKILAMAEQGVQVRYTPGNHDECLRNYKVKVEGVEVCDEFVHVTADDRRFLIMHGDKFDNVEKQAPWMSWIGDIFYDALLRMNQPIDFVRKKMGLSYWSLSSAIKGRVKQFTSFLSDFEGKITRYATEKECDGVLCGHIHTPALRVRDGVIYCNTGDWVESCTAIVEYTDGSLELLHRPPEEHRRRDAVLRRLPARQKVSVPAIADELVGAHSNLRDLTETPVEISR